MNRFDHQNTVLNPVLHKSYHNFVKTNKRGRNNNILDIEPSLSAVVDGLVKNVFRILKEKFLSMKCFNTNKFLTLEDPDCQNDNCVGCRWKFLLLYHKEIPKSKIYIVDLGVLHFYQIPQILLNLIDRWLNHLDKDDGDEDGDDRSKLDETCNLKPRKTSVTEQTGSNLSSDASSSPSSGFGTNLVSPEICRTSPPENSILPYFRKYDKIITDVVSKAITNNQIVHHRAYEVPLSQVVPAKKQKNSDISESIEKPYPWKCNFPELLPHWWTYRNINKDLKDQEMQFTSYSAFCKSYQFEMDRLNHLNQVNVQLDDIATPMWDKFVHDEQWNQNFNIPSKSVINNFQSTRKFFIDQVVNSFTRFLMHLHYKVKYSSCAKTGQPTPIYSEKIAYRMKNIDSNRPDQNVLNSVNPNLDFPVKHALFVRVISGSIIGYDQPLKGALFGLLNSYDPEKCKNLSENSIEMNVQTIKTIEDRVKKVRMDLTATRLRNMFDTVKLNVKSFNGDESAKVAFKALMNSMRERSDYHQFKLEDIERIHNWKTSIFFKELTMIYMIEYLANMTIFGRQPYKSEQLLLLYMKHKTSILNYFSRSEENIEYYDHSLSANFNFMKLEGSATIIFLIMCNYHPETSRFYVDHNNYFDPDNLLIQYTFQLGQDAGRLFIEKLLELSRNLTNVPVECISVILFLLTCSDSTEKWMIESAKKQNPNWNRLNISFEYQRTICEQILIKYNLKNFKDQILEFIMDAARKNLFYVYYDGFSGHDSEGNSDSSLESAMKSMRVRHLGFWEIFIHYEGLKIFD